MPSIDSIIAFAVASLALLVIPGPAVLYVINRSIADGRSIALAGVAGLEIGNFVHVIAATIGLSALIAASATAFGVVKWIGAGYLIFIGIRTIIRKPAAFSQEQKSLSRRKSFTQGIIVNTFNPKVALFFLSFLPQFIDENSGSAAMQSLFLGTLFVAIGLCTDGMYAILASALRNTLLRGRSLPFIQRYVAGSVFVLLGIVASTARRS